MIGNAPNNGFGMPDGLWLNGLANGTNRSFANGIVAHAGGGKDDAFQIPASKSMVSIDTVATAGDSLLLPQAVAGTWLMVRNAGVESANLYGKDTNQINGAATANAYALASNVSALFFCAVDGQWSAIKSA